MTIAITDEMVEAYASATAIERGTYAPDLIRQGLEAVATLIETQVRAEFATEWAELEQQLTDAKLVAAACQAELSRIANGEAVRRG